MELYGITLINGRKSMGFTGRYFTPRFSWSYGHLLLTVRDSLCGRFAGNHHFRGRKLAITFEDKKDFSDSKKTHNRLRNHR